MKRVELYGRVRHAVMIEGLSQREAARCFGIDPRTVRKMLSYSVPPGYVRTRPPVRPKLDPFIAIIDRILEEDKDRPKKQRHTSKRIFERLRDEYGFTGKITIVQDYICGVRQRRREMFVPLTHPPGHGQVDFGEALAVIGGVERKIHFLAMSLPHSDACFVKAYPGETTEAFCDGHVSGFSFFGGVPRSILYDNTRIAVARILGDGKRQRTRVFSELRSHYLFEDRFGRPGKGNDKGKVAGIVGYCRRNFLVPMPRFRNFDDLNTHLEACCAKRWAEQLRGHDQTVGERLERDRAVLQRLPAIAYDACDIEREIEAPLDDGVHTYLTVKFPIVDDDDRITGIGAISSDITESKRAQEALREARDDLEARVAARTEELTEANRALRAREAQLRQAHQITKLGHWSWHPETDHLFVSPEMAAILGVAPKELEVIANTAFVERFVHPDDREKVHGHGGAQNKEEGRFTVEYRLRRPDGSECWVEELGEPMVDATGKVIREVGTIQDISGRKRAESALRESEERFWGIFEQRVVSDSWWKLVFGVAPDHDGCSIRRRGQSAS